MASDPITSDVFPSFDACPAHSQRSSVECVMPRRGEKENKREYSSNSKKVKKQKSTSREKKSSRDRESSSMHENRAAKDVFDGSMGSGDTNFTTKTTTTEEKDNSSCKKLRSKPATRPGVQFVSGEDHDEREMQVRTKDPRMKHRMKHRSQRQSSEDKIRHFDKASPESVNEKLFKKQNSPQKYEDLLDKKLRPEPASRPGIQFVSGEDHSESEVQVRTKDPRMKHRMKHPSQRKSSEDKIRHFNKASPVSVNEKFKNQNSPQSYEDLLGKKKTMDQDAYIREKFEAGGMVDAQKDHVDRFEDEYQEENEEFDTQKEPDNPIPNHDANHQFQAVASRGMVSAPHLQYGLPTGGFVDGINDGVASADGDNFDDDDVAIAIAIPVDDSYYESQEYYHHAMEYDPDAKPPLHKNRRFRFYAIITTLVIVLIGTAVGVTIPLLFSKDNGENSPTFAPTDAPTTTAEGIYRDQFIAVVGPQVNVDDSAHDRAAHWIMYEDRQRLSPLSESLIQRYILVLFYFKTTNNEATPWKSCNRPRFNEDAACDFQHFTRSPLDDSIIFEPEKATRWLSNMHECDWVGVTCDEGAIVVALDIWGQNLAGPLPSELSHIPFLQSISLGYNDFTGTLPIEFAEMRHLVNLEVNGNQLDGSIPPEFWKTLTLQNFNVVENAITGTLSTEVGFLTNLKGLHLSDNLLQGTLPTEIGNLQFLSYARADGNQLTGAIPTQLGSLRLLQELWLHENLLSGTIPIEFGLLAEIGELRLFRNRIYGTIPDQLWDNKTQLKRLDLQDMLLSGTLSTRIGDLQKLETIRLRRNRLTGTIPTEMAKLRSLRLAWFHLNQFSGSVPLQLCSRVRPGFLEFLNADCGPDGAPAQECECCHGCCDRNTELCQLMDDN